MIRKFVGRKTELKALEKYYKTQEFEFIVIYGRRRIGKTTLIKEFIKNKPSIYFLCDKRGTIENIRRLKNLFYEYYNIPKVESNDLEEILKFALNHINLNKKFVLVFDEFPYLIEKDPDIVSVFQRVVDNFLNNQNIMLILSGSSMSMMEKEVLGYSSPLYGRKTYSLKLLPLNFTDYFEFYYYNDVIKNIEFYSITSGIPGYMKFLDDKKSFKDNIIEEIASVEGRLFHEVDFILRSEFREPETYKKILFAIASGNHKVVDIANNVGIMPNILSNYLYNLLSLGIISKEVIDITKKVRSKKVRYVITDNFIEFYMRFVDPYRSDLEIDYKTRFLKNLELNLNKYIAKKFEELVRKELIFLFHRNHDKVINYIGKKNKEEVLEIDILAVNEQTKEMLAVEVKWQDLKLRDVKSIIDELHEKLQYVQWHNNERKETLGIFAKKVDKKAREWLIAKGYKVWDLRDVERKIK